VDDILPSCTYISSSLTLDDILPEKSKTDRGSEGPGLALLAGAHSVFLLESEDFTSVFCTIAAHVPYSSLSSKNTGKEGDCKSNSI
jgi:hypothetical protein